MRVMGMPFIVLSVVILGTAVSAIVTCGGQREDNLSKTSAETLPCDGPLLCDASFERSAAPNQFGYVFPQWDGWRYEGDAEFRGQIFLGEVVAQTENPKSVRWSARTFRSEAAQVRTRGTVRAI